MIQLGNIYASTLKCCFSNQTKTLFSVLHSLFPLFITSKNSSSRMENLENEALNGHPNSSLAEKTVSFLSIIMLVGLKYNNLTSFTINIWKLCLTSSLEFEIHNLFVLAIRMITWSMLVSQNKRKTTMNQILRYPSYIFSLAFTKVTQIGCKRYITKRIFFIYLWKTMSTLIVLYLF